MKIGWKITFAFKKYKYIIFSSLVKIQQEKEWGEPSK